MHKIFLVGANIYFELITTSEFIYSGRVNNPRYIMKGTDHKNLSKSGYGVFFFSEEKKKR